ncbi:LPXTG-site transpeptidase (sortase) family protein [Micromonospora pisi]|uniref:LPXTG-site transpeptidase (Sortase) family protein n=1 Tax=Micromonospora pisi TaxID=589240 RepID=A0A495JEI9_9ACTN|nr:class F sortase [Micromonospora pisi]RKR87253.1 LPXTG-site transpeptidase (sortase) family protein [Micromonospora pisi]
MTRLLLLGVSLLLVGAVSGTDDGPGPRGTGPASTGPASPDGAWHAGCASDCPPTSPVTTTRGTDPLPGPAPADSTAGPPTRVRIPRIGVDSSLAVLGLDRSGQLETPADYAQAGWFGAGPSPGDTGPAVIAGHVDSTTGPAVFYRLHELRAGDRVEVRRGTTWIPFRVVATSRHAKDDFPTAEVYDPTPGPELRLITCTGSFDRATRNYHDNLVVFAVAG